jgi:ubiquinone/menaquinone biosynthesis C-methylase UbiE
MDDRWWQAFFDHADSLVLSRFPPLEETKQEIFALQELVPLRPDDLIADICCGMGRHLLPLMALGHRLIGLDYSPMMLRLAAEMGRQAGLQPTLVQGAAQALPFADGAFDVMLNLFNSFGYLPTDEENLQVLREAARCLKPGGRFFLDTRNNTHQILYAPYHELIKVGKTRQLVMRCTYDAESRRLQSCWFDAEDQSRLVHQASIRLYSPDELAGMLEEVGLELVARYGGYDGHEFEGWERELLLLCHRYG